MNYHELREWIDTIPFSPFRITATNGRTFDITNPTLIWPGKYTVMIGLPDNPGEPDIPARHITLAMLHIVTVDPLETAAAS